MRQNAALFFFFALVATLCDRSWIGLDAMRYYPLDPNHLWQPWWVPLQYGVMGLLAVHFAALVTRYLVPRDTEPPRDPLARFAISASWFVAAFIAGGLFDATRARRLAVVLVAVWLVRFLLQRPRGGEALAVLVITAGLAAAGTAGEIVLVWLGVMEYTRPAFCGLPWWVPGLYLHAGYLARDIARAWFNGR
ncbi:MAG TPA: hypothetical protein VF618_22410 [Thermoanaerobaculia bacterium]